MDHTQRFKAESVITANSRIEDAIQLLGARNDQNLFVLDGPQVVAIFDRECLWHPATLLYFFGVTAMLEVAALELCAKFGDKCLLSLGRGRLGKMLEVYRTRYSSAKFPKKRWGKEIEALLSCTTFIDKATMISKTKLLIDWSNQRLRTVFSRAERLRNACAHPTVDATALETTLEPVKIGRLMTDIRDLTDTIRRLTPP